MVPFYLFSISGSNQIVLLMLPHYPLYDSHLQLAASQHHSLGATCLAARCLCAPFQTQLGFFGCAVPAEQLRPNACLTLTPHSYEKRTIHPVVDNYGIILQWGGNSFFPLLALHWGQAARGSPGAPRAGPSHVPQLQPLTILQNSKHCQAQKLGLQPRAAAELRAQTRDLQNQPVLGRGWHRMRV